MAMLRSMTADPNGLHAAQLQKDPEELLCIGRNRNGKHVFLNLYELMFLLCCFAY